jgi:hypothetical protein
VYPKICPDSVVFDVYPFARVCVLVPVPEIALNDRSGVWFGDGSNGGTCGDWIITAEIWAAVTTEEEDEEKPLAT